MKRLVMAIEGQISVLEDLVRLVEKQAEFLRNAYEKIDELEGRVSLLERDVVKEKVAV